MERWSDGLHDPKLEVDGSFRDARTLGDRSEDLKPLVHNNSLACVIPKLVVVSVRSYS